MKLNSVHIQECTEERMERERETSRKVVDEDHAFMRLRMRDLLILIRPAIAAGTLRDLALFLQKGEGPRWNI